VIRVVCVLRFTEVLPVFLICFACTQQHRACVHEHSVAGHIVNYLPYAILLKPFSVAMTGDGGLGFDSGEGA